MFSRVFPALIIAVALLIGGCSQRSAYPPEVAAILEAADDNRNELEQVITHYRAAGDSLKLEAAYFLIGNMQGHSYATYALEDSSGAELEFAVLDYVDFNSLLAGFDSLEQDHGTLDFARDEKYPDLDTITAAFLIDQIDYAFRAWQEKPWASGLSFDVFKEYVLPYRGSNEPLESWRELFWRRYEGIDTLMADTSDPVEAAVQINNEIRSWFRFDPRYYYHPTDQGAAEMLEVKLGRCEDMTNLTIFAMRANGLAVTSDYTPYWADAGNNHAWNSIVTPDGKLTPFMGAEADPGKYRLANKLAKVYRKMFSEQKANLIFLERKQEEVPRWLAGRSYRDVTADYVDVCDVAVTFELEIPDSVDIAYLCVFNSGEFKAIHWGRIDEGRAVFTDMGRDIVYLPALYLNGEIVPYGAPFLLASDCSLIEFKADTAGLIDLTLTAAATRQQVASTDGVSYSLLKSGREYELSYWQDGWQSVTKVVAGDEPLTFSGVPAGALYWLVATGSDEDERIFTYEDGRQVWW